MTVDAVSWWSSSLSSSREYCPRARSAVHCHSGSKSGLFPSLVVFFHHIDVCIISSTVPFQGREGSRVCVCVCVRVSVVSSFALLSAVVLQCSPRISRSLVCVCVCVCSTLVSPIRPSSQTDLIPFAVLSSEHCLVAKTESSSVSHMAVFGIRILKVIDSLLYVYSHIARGCVRVNRLVGR